MLNFDGDCDCDGNSVGIRGQTFMLVTLTHYTTCGIKRNYLQGLSMALVTKVLLVVTLISGGSRISQRRERQPPRWGRQPIIWSNISRKLYENKRIWTWWGASLVPPLRYANAFASDYFDINSVAQFWPRNSDLSIQPNGNVALKTRSHY